MQILKLNSKVTASLKALALLPAELTEVAYCCSALIVFQKLLKRQEHVILAGQQKAQENLSNSPRVDCSVHRANIKNIDLISFSSS